MARSPSDFLTQGIGRFLEGSRYNREQHQQDDAREESQQQDVIQQSIQGLRQALTQGAQQTEMQKRLAAQMEMEQQRAAAHASESMKDRSLRLRLAEMAHDDPEKAARLKLLEDDLASKKDYRSRQAGAAEKRAGRPLAPRGGGQDPAAKARAALLQQYNVNIRKLEDLNSREASAYADPTEKKALKALINKQHSQLFGAPDEDSNPSDADDRY